MSVNGDISIFEYKVLDNDLPKIGIAFLFTVIASNTPSHNTIGKFQLIKFSKNIMSFDASGFLYL